MTGFAKIGLINKSDFANLKMHINFICEYEIFHHISTMIGKSCYQIKAVGQMQAELPILKVEKLDSCIRPLSVIQSHI